MPLTSAHNENANRSLQRESAGVIGTEACAVQDCKGLARINGTKNVYRNVNGSSAPPNSGNGAPSTTTAITDTTTKPAVPAPSPAGRRLVVLLAKVLVVVGILLASWYVSQHASLETLRTAIAASGALSEWVYLACWIVLPAFLFPVPVLALAGGALFGVVKGTLLTLVGALLNAAFMYAIARFVAKDFVTRLVRKHVGASLQKRLLTTNQWQLGSVFFVMRLIPLVSYNMANYVAGITNIRFWVHMLETFLGIIPGTVIFLNMGDKLYQPGSTEFWIAIALLAVLIIVPLIIARAFFGDVIHERKHHNSNI